MGLLRWISGLLVGVFILLAPRDQLLLAYIAIHVPVRIFEWLVLSAVVLPRGARWPPVSRVPWIMGGIVLSFLADRLCPEMLEHGHFCVGRCLC
jgi:hypothetical protein